MEWRETGGKGLERVARSQRNNTGAAAETRPTTNPNKTTQKQPEKPEGWESRFSNGTAFRRMLFRAATGAWEAGVTPGSVIRAIGPWGPSLVEKYVGGRFSYHGKRLDAEEARAFR